MKFKGTKGSDTFTGTSGADTFDLSQGGNDIANGGGGGDTFTFKAAFTAKDQINGGSGNDVLSLAGDYSKGVTFGSKTLLGVETITLGKGDSYKLTTNDATVAKNATLTVDASKLGAGNTLTFDGSHETDGKFAITGGAGADTIKLGSSFKASYAIDGGAGNDVVNLSGGGTVKFGAKTMTNVEKIVLAAGDNYNLTTNDATVASGKVLTIDAHNLAAGNSLTFDGSLETNGNLHVTAGAGNDLLTGGKGNDIFTGGDGANTFDLSAGGNDTPTGGAGADIFHFGGALTAGDHVDGAGGSDFVFLNGDYSGGLTLTSAMLTGVENLAVTGNHSYVLTAADSLVAANTTLTVDASALTAGHSLNFDGSAEADGAFTIIGGAGDDIIIGGAKNDIITLSTGTDSVQGGAGFNTFIAHSADVLSGTTIETATGTNVLQLNGDFSGGLTLTSDLAANLESITLASGHNYSLTAGSSDAIGAGGLVIGAADTNYNFNLTFDGSAETVGGFNILPGKGDDVLTGGSQPDFFHLVEGGNDTVRGGGGADIIDCGILSHNGTVTLVYGGAPESSSTTYDSIGALNFAHTTFELNVAVSSISAQLSGETVNTGTFDADMATAIGAHMAAHSAIVVEVTDGSPILKNHFFLVVDADGSASYTGGIDYVFDITGYSGTISTGNFTTEP